MSIHEYYIGKNIKLKRIKEILTKETIVIENSFGNTPLNYLCKNTSINLKIMKYVASLMPNTIEVNKCIWNTTTYSYNIPAFHELCWNKSLTVGMIQCAVKTGALFDTIIIHDTTPIHRLCCNKDIDFNTLQYVIIHGAKLHSPAQTGFYDYTTPFDLLRKNKAITKKQIQQLGRNRNVRIFLFIQLLRYTICGPIILEELMII
jgi:hypothetical protein